MALEDIVNVTITSESRGVSRAGFGTTLVCGATTVFAERTREYSLGTAVTDMIADGFSAFDPMVRCVQAVASNSPKSKKVLLGRTSNGSEDASYDAESTLTVLPVAAEAGQVFGFDFTTPDGTVTAIEFIATGGEDQDDIAGALALLINVLTDVGASSESSPDIDISADSSDEMYYVTNYSLKLFAYEDTTAEDNIVVQLNAVFADSDDWYTLVMAEPPGGGRVIEIATIIEAKEKLFGTTTFNTKVGDPGEVNVMQAMKDAGFFRTFCIFSTAQKSFSAATWTGGRLPFDPGSQTWAYKALPGVAVDELSNAFQSSILAKNGNMYVEIAGIGVTLNGKTSGGEWIDIIRGRDWLVARLRERIFQLLANAPKVPFTDGGIDQIKAQVTAQLNEGINSGYLSPDPDPPFTVTAPLAAEVSSADKLNRLLPDVSFTATLAGAIHAVEISGTLQI